MKKLTSKRTLVLGLALLGLVNAIALTGAAWNRGAEEARLSLSDREFKLPWSWSDPDDDSSLWLELDYFVAGSDDEDGLYLWSRNTKANWLDAHKLTELGFDTTPPPIPFGDRFDVAGRSRAAFAVLEFDGPLRAALLRRLNEKLVTGSGNNGELSKRIHELETSEPRLFVVDAGLDASKLRTLYPNRHRYAIVPAVIGMDWWLENSQLKIRGSVEKLTVTRIHLDASQAASIGVRRRKGFMGDNSPQPEFNVELAFGRRGEPWLLSARKAAPR